MNRSKVLIELKDHIPFTALASLIAIILAGVFYFLNKEFVLFVPSLFYILHPAHIFFSALATSAVFYKYKKSFFQAVLVGIFGSVLIGSLSDIVFPYLGGVLFDLSVSFHLEVIEKPVLILSVALIGGLGGIWAKAAKLPHFAHVFLSVFASLFYLLAFTVQISPTSLIVVFFIVFAAVLVPCCISDIVFPMFFAEMNEL